MVIQPVVRGSVTKYTTWYDLGQGPFCGISHNVDEYGNTKMLWSKELSELTVTQDLWNQQRGRQFFTYDISSLSITNYVTELELEVDLGTWVSSSPRKDNEDISVYVGWGHLTTTNGLNSSDWNSMVGASGYTITKVDLDNVFYQDTGPTTLNIPITITGMWNHMLFSRTSDLELCVVFSGDLSEDEDLYGNAQIKKYYGDLTLLTTTNSNWS